MATTSTYVPFAGRNDQCKGSLPGVVHPTGLIGGSGTPEGNVIGNPGQRYRDLDNDYLYTKLQGTKNRGWVRTGSYAGSGAAGAASGGVFSSAVDPTGVLSVTGAAVCVGSGALEGQVWVKSTSGTSADDWVLVLS